MKIRTTRNTVAAAMVFLVLSGVSAVGHASINSEEFETERVNYSDLDIEKAEGREALIKRLRHAARRVCDQPGRNSLRQVMFEQECTQSALEAAMREMGLKREVAARAQRAAATGAERH